MTDRRLSSLSSEFRPIVVEVLAALTERGIPVMIIQTSRTEAEHQVNLVSEHSKVKRSKHLPRFLRGYTKLVSGLPDPDVDKADAIDLCPYEVYTLAPGGDKLSWDTKSPAAKAAWKAIGEEGESRGLRWGGRWAVPYDPGHLELLMPGERYRDIPATAVAFAMHGVPPGGAG